MTGLLLSHQRCGSSALTRFLRLACGVHAPMEVLNRKSLTRNLPGWQSAPAEEVDAHVAAALSENQLVKHIYGDHDPAFDARLVQHPQVGSLVLLWREDVDAAALSAAIARATGHYNRRPGDTGHMRPIQPGQVRRHAEQMRLARRTTEATVQASGKPVLSLRYEDLYQPSEDGRREQVHRLIDFLGLSTTPQFDEAFTRYLAPDRKINDGRTYALIPNFEQLQQAFPELLGHVEERA